MRPILILAAGTSSRMMGADKLLQPVGGAPLLRTLTLRALAASDDVYVALRPASAPRLAALDGLAITPLIVPQATEGMSGTLRGAIPQLPDADFMLLLADLPDITTEDISAIWAAHDTQPDHLIWRGATASGKPGHPIIFAASLRPAFAQLHGDGGGEAIVAPLRDRTHLSPFDDDRARRDLDTPEDWAAWRGGQ